jgi:hypothetical protein
MKSGTRPDAGGVAFFKGALKRRQLDDETVPNFGGGSEAIYGGRMCAFPGALSACRPDAPAEDAPAEDAWAGTLGAAASQVGPAGSWLLRRRRNWRRSRAGIQNG